MMDNSQKNQNFFSRIYSYCDFLIILVISSIPLFLHFNYRINIFLSWEGAYRLYLGQIPYKDYGLPLGFGYWILPGVFFKIFGPYLLSLVKAQVFINIISGLAFRSILRSFRIESGLVTLSLIVYSISFSFNNFWPWYNHTVMVYEFIGLAFLLQFLRKENQSLFSPLLIFSAFFLFLSFFTKQDAGGMGILLGLALLGFYAWVWKKPVLALVFGLYILIWGLIFFLPFVPYRIGYWFNHGQSPHSSRLSAFDFLDAFLSGSMWIKFYLLLIFLIFWQKFLPYFKDLQRFREHFWDWLFLLFSLGILFEAALFQVSSYVPVDNNIFFHSFAFAFIFHFLPYPLDYRSKPVFFSLLVLILFWWSQTFWIYMGGVKTWLTRNQTKIADSVITIHTYKIPEKDSTNVPVGNWVPSSLSAFRKVWMPPGTVNGIKRIMNLKEAKIHGLKFLNMSELTPLEYELKANLEKGSNIPLWYHRGVGMFSNQTMDYCKKIHNGFYDLVLYEYIPDLNNFYPFKIQDTLNTYYKKIDRFTAPRNPSNHDFIEVYIRKTHPSLLSK
jgi:hypothetical protein